MTATPDGISFGDLQKHMDDARKRDEVREDVELIGGMTPDQIVKLCDTAADELMEKCSDPMVHKAMIVELCERMVAWHTSAGIAEMEDDNIKSAVFWERDAGKFQAMLNILSSISMGSHDFLMR